MKTIIFAVLVVSFSLFSLQVEADPRVQLATRDRPILNPSSSRLIATQQEVSQFFDSYVERYTGRDVDGFLRLFSLNAIQNQSDGLAGIREIYSKFFDQTRTFRYRFEDRKVEIYENAVEVKARYKIEQIRKQSGEKKVFKGRIRWVLTKEDGTLKILIVDYKNEKAP